jgi:hypothetical protein
LGLFELGFEIAGLSISISENIFTAAAKIQTRNISAVSALQDARSLVTHFFNINLLMAEESQLDEHLFHGNSYNN